ADQALRAAAQGARAGGRRGDRHPEGEAAGDREGLRSPDRGAVHVSGGALLAAISGEDMVQTGFSGIALGCKYALIALGFSIIFKATGVINFAQGGFVLIGAYFTYNVTQTWGQNFYVALV